MKTTLNINLPEIHDTTLVIPFPDTESAKSALVAMVNDLVENELLRAGEVSICGDEVLAYHVWTDDENEVLEMVVTVREESE